MSSPPQQPRSNRDIIRRSYDAIADRLPESWALELREGSDGADALLTLQAADGERAEVTLRARRALEARDVAALGEGIVVGLVAAPYLNPSVRTALAERGIGYADATGNLRLELDRPALFLRDTGADRDPWRGPGRPRGSFNGGSAARVFRALADFTPPYSIPELVRRSGASTGVTYRVVDFLEREAIIERRSRAGIIDVDWRRMLQRWSEVDGFSTSPSATAFLAPRGLEDALGRLRKAAFDYALTSSSGAQHYAPYAPLAALSIYVTSLDEAAESLAVRPAHSGGGNIVLAVPVDPVAFERARSFDGLVVAAPSQVAVDLLGGPGRAPEEGRFLLDWMEADESAWRE